MPDHDASVELQDLSLQCSQLTAESRKTRTGHFREPAVGCIRDDLKQLLDAPAPDRGHDTELGKVGSPRSRLRAAPAAREAKRLGGLEVDTIAAAGDDAINFSSASFSNGFAGQSCSVAGLPSDPHFHNLTVLAQCANGRSQSSIAGCLAVQNNADGCHTLRP